jgi:thymidylate kinase
MPKPDKVFLLNASPDVLLSRKREVEPNVLKGIVSRYRIIIESNPRGVLIDASQPIAKVAEDVLGELSIILGEDV